MVKIEPASMKQAVERSPTSEIPNEQGAGLLNLENSAKIREIRREPLWFKYY